MGNPTWQDVTSAPEWETLPPEQRSAVQQKFFSSVVMPNIPEGVDPKAAWQQFGQHTADSIAAPVRATGLRAAIASTPFGMAADAMDPNSDSVGGNIVRGAGRGLVRGARGLLVAGAGANEALNPTMADEGNSTLFGMADKLKGYEDRIPQARSTGGRVAQGVGGFGAGLVTAGSGEAGATGQDLLDRGATLGQAEAGTAISGAGAAAGVGMGGINRIASLPGRIAAQSVAGGALAEGSRRAENAVLPENMHQDFDPVQFGIGVGGAATGAFFPHGGENKVKPPLDKGHDLLNPDQNASIGTEDPANHNTAGVPPTQTFTRGYQIMRDSSGKPFGVVPSGGGDVVPLNGRDVNDVIDGMRQIVPYKTPDAVHIGPGEEPSVIDSTARDVTQKQLPAPSRGPPAPTEPLALPAPPNFTGDKSGQVRAQGDETPQPLPKPIGESQPPASSETTSDGRPLADDHSWVNIDPREHPEEFGLTKPESAPDNLLHFLAKAGGLNLDAFKSQFGTDRAVTAERKTNQAVVGKPLFKKQGGLTPDEARALMQEHGWLPQDDQNAPPSGALDDVNDKLNDALAGKPVHNENNNDAHYESAIKNIEQAQLGARAHLDLAKDLQMSPHGLDQEVARHADQHMPTDVKGMEPADAHQAMSIDDLESMALHNGVDQKAASDAFFASKNQHEFASKLGDLITQARDKHGSDNGSAAQGARELPGAAQGGKEPVHAGGGVDQSNDAGAAGGVRGAGQVAPESNGAGAPAPAGQVDAFGKPTTAETNRAAIAAKDAQRNSGTVVDKGDGGLFDGPRPQQDSFASRVGMRAAKGVAVQRAREIITRRYGRVADMLFKNGKLHIVADESELPRGMEHLSSDDSLLQGVHNRATGESWVVGNSLTEKNVTGVVLHEVGVHEGLAKLLGDDKMSRLAGQLRVIGETGKPAEKAHVGEALRRIDNEPTSARDEELVAHSIELLEAARQGDSITPRLKVWLADAVSHIKAGLYNMGFLKAKHLDLNDIRHLAEGAMKRVARGTITQKPGALNEQLKSSQKLNDGAEGSKGDNAVSASGRGSDVSPGKSAGGATADSVSGPKASDVHAEEVDTSPEGAAANLKKWFGDGVLKDADGKPSVYYRGDPIDLTSWDESRHGGHTASPLSQLGMFLTKSEHTAEKYAESHGDNGKVMSAYARLKNPARENSDTFLKAYPTDEAMAQKRAELIAKGHDGIVFDNADEVVAFDPNHDVKRTDNHGSYDENVPNFMFSRVKENANSAHENADVHTEEEKPVGKFRAAAAAKFGELAHAFFMRVTPMADNHASPEARAIAKDFANLGRMAGHEYTVADKALKENFTPEQQERMWKAANEESELRQQGLPTKGKGLDTLAPDERAAVEHEQARSQEALQAAIEAGLFDGARNADGTSAPIPSYVPRMVIRRLAGVAERFGKSGEIGKNGANVRTSSPGLLARKHLLNEDTTAAAQARDADAEVLTNIRTLPLATKRLWDAVAGRTLVNQIRDAGNATGENYMQSGAKPGEGWFTLPDHPAFTEFVRRTETDPDTGKLRNALDEFHEPIYDSKPIWIRKDFEGPLKAVMSQNADAIERMISEIKVKTMSGIMISPAIHLMTELGRSVPAMPGKFLQGKVFSAGRAALADPAVMREAIEIGGVAPIAGRGGSNDAVELANERNIKPGRSWTSQVLAAIPNLFDPKAGEAVKRAVDTAGDFVHNKMLWDQIAKLQMGLFVHFRDEAIKGGFSRNDALRMAGHEANRFAGTLPKEATSVAARQMGNLLMFSRTFTLGNWGVMKDALKGLPRDVQAQILRDSGANGLARAQSFTQRRSLGILAADIGLMYVGNALLQNFFAVATGGSNPNKEMEGYVRRSQEWMQKVEKNPMEAFHLLGDISPTHDNEPGKQDRILVGHRADGTAIYLRNPFGKIGEEFLGWSTQGLDMIKRKLSPMVRPAWETLSNDKDGFGTKVYNPHPRSDSEWWQNAGKIAMNIVGDQLNTALVTDTKSILAGDKDASISALKLVGNLTGFTASKGAPGGEAVGEMYAQKNAHSYDLQQNMPAIRKQIEAGDIAGAVKAMTAIGVDPKIQEYYIKTTINPSSRLSATQLQKFMQTAPPEEQAKMKRYLQH